MVTLAIRAYTLFPARGVHMRTKGKDQREKKAPEASEIMALTLARYAVKSRAQARYLRERLADVSNLILTRWLFLRLLALIYLVAFLSFWSQCDALIGPQGILPAGETLARVQETADETGEGLSYAFGQLPTLCWMGDGYAAPTLCLVGVAAALVVMTGFAQPVGFFVLWLCYLSVIRLGWVFAGGLGDQLLLEAGFLAIFFAPFVLQERTTHEPWPSDLILFLYRLLLFRVVLGAALAKFGSGDGMWYPSFEALAQYYQSQPLPTPVAWYLHQLPATVHRLGTALLLGAEVLLPLAIFASRRIRVYGALGIMILQVLILFSGNFGILNWLTIALAVLALDDEIVPLKWRGKWCVGEAMVRPRLMQLAQTVAQSCLAICVISVSMMGMIRQIEGAVQQNSENALFQGPATIARLGETLSRFGIVGTYGMPVQVRTDRLALVVEGSEDGEDWKPYAFRYHHGPEDRAPAWVAPFLPRLDWQLSLAAGGILQDPTTQRWLLPLMVRLFENQESVLRLLAANPFPEQPPRYLRVMVYNYRFTTAGERRSSRAWWNRQFLRVYCPPVTVDQIRNHLLRLPQMSEPTAVPPRPPPQVRRPPPQVRQSPSPAQRQAGPRIDKDGFVTE